MLLRSLALAFATLLTAGCTATANPPISSSDTVTKSERPDAKHNIYWAFFGGLHQSNPQLQTTTIPLSSSSKVRNINGTTRDMLANICCVRVYKNLI